MTRTPAPALTAVLDELDELHEEWSTNGLDVDTTNGEVWNALFRRPRWMSEPEVHDLVAEHNAVPKLTAALRAVLNVHGAIDAVQYLGSRQVLCRVCTGCGSDDGNWQLWPCPTVAAITTALDPSGAAEGARR